MSSLLSSVLTRLFIDARPTLQHSPQTPSLRVLLLGWGGSKPRHLRKIVEYYKQKDAQVTTFIMPMGVPLFVREALENKLVETLTEAQQSHSAQSPTPPFVCHVYSNNGIWVYGSLIQRKDFPPVHKVILDSAPYLWYDKGGLLDEAKGLTPVITSVVLQKPVYNHPTVSPLVQSSLVLFLVASRFFEALQSLSPMYLRLVADMVGLNNYLLSKAKLPQDGFLVVYSTGDKLIAKENIIDFKERALVARGAKVQELVFGDDVAHTSGFFVHNKIYTERLDNFLFGKTAT